ncbi:hypothetical protein IC229_11175 [Spirosoma sp. BT702]|uniref:Uncharacterized protein n=1 Tax=Spirosoma profusum TaxID=2771354 RepID=A0A926XW97_9BACT|nr:hypothetical protein [Spirosoma profusum]MBD2701200.1 hypothetical protein [Spirosoma profusum]
MRAILLMSLLGLTLLTSCTRSLYHVSSVQSEQVKLMDKDFTSDNEHLNVVYDLWEEGGRMRFLLLNKTDKPIYIDWSKSFVIRNDTKIVYSPLALVSKKAYVDTVRYTYQNAHVEPLRVTARGVKQMVIPAKTLYAIADLPLGQAVQYPKTDKKVFNFTKENSPLRLTHQIAYTFDPTLANEQSVEHSFWLSSLAVVRNGELIRQYGSLEKGQPNAFYVVEKRPSTPKTIVLAVTTIAAGTGIMLLILDNMLKSLTL